MTNISVINLNDDDDDDNDEKSNSSSPINNNNNNNNIGTKKPSYWLWKSFQLLDIRRRVAAASYFNKNEAARQHSPPPHVDDHRNQFEANPTRNTIKLINQKGGKVNAGGCINLDRFVKPFINKLAMKLSCCACCCFYPKYKRKVDNIYPHRRQVDAPLVKNEVDKLQYYVTVHPEKLAKIGDCLYHHLKRGLNDKNRNYVKNTIEAVEKILVVIQPQNLSYFAPYYFKIIQKLLEQSGSSSTSGTLVRSGSAGKKHFDYALHIAHYSEHLYFST